LRESLSGKALVRAATLISDSLTVSGDLAVLGVSTHAFRSFQPAHGTILFFTDTTAVAEAKVSHPSYAHGFDAWAAQSQGTLQGTIWTALSLEGIGVSLQHYHVYAGVSEAIRKAWVLPETWGKPVGPSLTEKRY
jgi:predicted oxidoreductase (fatty acid repression mutant protein)